MSDELVLSERREGYAVVTLNRPKALNALSDELMAALDEALDRARRRRRRALRGADRRGARLRGRR